MEDQFIGALLPVPPVGEVVGMRENEAPGTEVLPSSLSPTF